jgi:hypothetical protein
MSDYLLANGLVALGIAADACLITVARAPHLRAPWDAARWSAKIGLTHWLFPLMGFAGGWYFARSPAVAFGVYLLGAVLMLYMTWRALMGALSGAFLREADSREEGALVIAVSLDALLAGPGKTAITESWTEAQIWYSFPLVGLGVFCLVGSTAAVASRMGSVGATPEAIVSGARKTAQLPRIARFFAATTCLQLMTFFGFSVYSGHGALKVLVPSLSIRYGVTLWVVASAVGIGYSWRRLWLSARSAAQFVVERVNSSGVNLHEP